jgi:hypothetical protein
MQLAGGKLLLQFLRGVDAVKHLEVKTTWGSQPPQVWMWRNNVPIRAWGICERVVKAFAGIVQTSITNKQVTRVS